MKKFLYFILILLILQGCTSLDPRGTYSKSEGFLYPKGSTTWVFGTHVLANAENEKLIVLSSENIDLTKYENKKVEVEGILKKGYPLNNLTPQYMDVKNIKEIEVKE